MAKDHYVAVTYLKHFSDLKTTGMLNAFSKKSGKNFQCYPKDVCHEVDGDINPLFENNTSLLGDFRAIFEPSWNSAIQAFVGKTSTNNDKFIVSAYMANLMVCTPAWKRIGQLTYAKNMQGSLEFKRKLHEDGKLNLDESMLKGIDMISRGELKIEIDENYLKGVMTKQLMNYAVLIYNVDWCLLENHTDEKFVTSDNPVAVESLGQFSGQLRRYLPLTPDLCLMIQLNAHKHSMPKDEEFLSEMRKPPLGRIYRAAVKRGEVREINKKQVMSAENLVFSSVASQKMAMLTEKYAKYQLDLTYKEFPTPDGQGRYLGVSVGVNEIA